MKKNLFGEKNSKILLGIMLYSVMEIYFLILEIKERTGLKKREVYKSLKTGKESTK